MANLLTIGHTTLDTFLILEDAAVSCDVNHEQCEIAFPLGAKLPVRSVHYGLGGGAANVAVGVQKLGHKSTIYTIVGGDSRGRDTIDNFKNFGINCDVAQMDEKPTDQSTIISYEQDRVIFSYKHNREYKLSVISRFHRYPFVFLSSIGQKIDHIYNGVGEWRKKSPQMNLFFNPGSREIANKRSQIANLLPHVDYLMVNLEEACSIINPTLKRDQIEPFDLLSLILEKGLKCAVVTDSENGVYIANKKDEFHLPSIPTKIAEKTGAGDAFASGFIAAIMYDKDLETAAEWGVRNASSVMTIIGAQNGLLNNKQILA